ncbi:hypothetical protein BDN70DRAFT_297981 [Pholiota conissans]|uniref:Uncharacterized protein n=1 Tax=Pholiota conissans TaxID=109636 RepID=A0A9P5YRX3_9AGAR|nr:hypothetical protein BDN70DRAFT_297981 [Pholiota conissans]
MWSSFAVVGARLPLPESLQVLHDVDASKEVNVEVSHRHQRTRPYSPHPTSLRAKAPRLHLPLHLTFLHHCHHLRFLAPYLQICTSSSRPHLTPAGHRGQRIHLSDRRHLGPGSTLWINPTVVRLLPT